MGDVLGLTPEQRTKSDLHQAWAELLATMNRNRQQIQDLLPGTVVRISGWGGPHPELTREQLLDVMI